ncbi:MAG: cation diffusion facilitator family transporter [Bdellovibrionota bacterium]|jgi:cation diffusion facilitator family transporter
MVDLKRYAYISIAAAVSTIALKTAAYFVTDSVGLLSDACESVVNLCAALIALFSLILAARPEDKEHAYGHNKIEYFSSGIEGVLILVAAGGIAWAAVGRILEPVELQEIDLGLFLSIVASLINLVVARILTKAGKSYESITLEADARHLMTDVWTSVAVVLGIGGVALTGWQVLDPIIALCVVGNIVVTGVELLVNSFHGLMDRSIPEDEIVAIEAVLDRYRGRGAAFHAFRTRQSGSRRFVSFHILLPGDWSLSKAHQFVEDIERDIRKISPKAHLSTHIEPIEDEAAYQDMGLDRE